MCSKDGKITGLRVDVIADHGAFDSTAQPTKFPAGFFHIVCGSYDLEASHVKVKAVYTNKAPGGVAYRCSFRITEAVYLVERMVDALALEMKADPIDLRMRSFIKPEQFPYETTTGWTYDSGEYAETMRVAMEIAGYEELRREQAEKRARGELMGIGVSFFTEGVGAGPRKHMDILGLSMNDGADLRVHPSGKAVVSISAQTQGQGHETTFAQIVAEELGIPPEDVEVRHGDTDKSPVRAGHLRQPLDAGLRRRGGDRLAQGPRQGADDRRDDAGDPARGPGLGEGPLVRQGRPGEGRDDRGDRASAPTAASRCPRAWRAGSTPR